MIRVRITPVGGDAPLWDDELERKLVGLCHLWGEGALCGQVLLCQGSEPGGPTKEDIGFHLKQPPEGSGEPSTAQTLQVHERSLAQKEFQGLICILQHT